ncbi:MAG: hypothetical protein N3B16_12710 [Candidatus Aminicenantes bacterium]|nr:hypothetical protein [Candidatus Aminicenantes bacterium]
MIEEIFKAKISRCLDLLATSLKSLNRLNQSVKVELNDYYRIRNEVREAKVAFEEIKKELHRLFGPPPPYAPRDYERLRQENLEKVHLLIKSEEKEKIVEELLQDEIVSRFFLPEEVNLFVEKNFDSQKKGKRKLANFKARLFYEKIKEDLQQAEQLINLIKSKAT